MLRNRGLLPSQIAILIQEQIDCGYAVMQECGLILASKGKDYLDRFYQSVSYKEKAKWILPQEQYYGKPLSEDTIVLPPRKI